MSSEILNALAGSEAADDLNKLFNTRPDQFFAAFKKASAQRTKNFADEVTTVASVWVEDYATSISASTSAKAVANHVLTNANLLKQIDTKIRFFLAEALFPHFELPAGWLVVAKRAGLERNVAAFIHTRVMAITKADVARETAFIQQLLDPPDDSRLSYRPLLDRAGYLRPIARHLNKLGVRHARSMGWRHGIG